MIRSLGFESGIGRKAGALPANLVAALGGQEQLAFQPGSPDHLGGDDQFRFDDEADVEEVDL